MKLLKIFWPVIFIIIVWFSFSYPFFVQNKVPFATTFLVNFFSPWNAYPGFSSPIKNNAMPDVISQIYPWKNFTIDNLRNGIIPLWNPYSFSGTPHLANYQSAVLSPFNLIFFILPFINAWSILVLLQPLLAGLFMYLYLKSLKISNTSSVFGSVSFMFCGFITTWMGYATLGYAILFLPLALFGIEKFYQTARFKYLFILLLSFPLSFFSGHFQISLYFFAFILFYSLFKFWETKDFKKSFYIFLYIIFGLLLCMPQLLPSIEAYSNSLRSSIFQKTEVIPLGYIATFFAPDFLGNPVTRNDWFGHYAEWNAFAGTIGILLSIYSLYYFKSKKVLFFIVAAVVSVLLSFGSPLTDLIVLLKIPVLSTSAASRVIILFSFSISVLSAFSIDFIIKDLKNYKKIAYWITASILIFVILWAVVFFKLFIPIDKIVIAKQNLILPTIFTFGMIISVLVSIYFYKNNKLNKYVFLLPLILILILSFDMLRFAKKWQEFDPKSLAYPNVAVVAEFNKIKGYDRVFGNLGGEATTYYGLQSIEGYDAVYIQRYGEFIAAAKNGDIEESERSVVLFPKYGLYSQKYLNLLGVKYLIHKIGDGQSPWTYPVWNYPDDYSLNYNDSVYQIFQNQKAYPRAYLVKNYSVQTDSQEIINKMFLNDYDLRQNVVLEKNPNIKLDSTVSDSRITGYQANKVTVETKTNGNSILVLSDSYYPGWSAYIDGKKTNIFRADFALRAVVIPKGNHKVVFLYEPDSFKFGVYLALIGVILSAVVLFFRGKIILFPKI